MSSSTSFGLAPWLPLDPEPPHRAELVATLLADFERPGMVGTLYAAPGAGATTVAGALAARLRARMPVIALRLAGCRDASLVTLAIGRALDRAFPGDFAAVSENLAELGDCLLILDDADRSEAASVVERLAACAPLARFLALGRAPVHGRTPLLKGVCHELQPLPTDLLRERFPAVDVSSCEGNPGRAMLLGLASAAGLDVRSFLQSLPAEAALLAACEGGVPGDPPEGIPQALLLPVDKGTCALRRFVAEPLSAIRPAAPAELALFLHGRCQELLTFADGWPLRRPLVASHQALLVEIAMHHPEPLQAARARASWSRGWIVAGQAAAGRGALPGHERGEREFTGGVEQAILAWAEGDALLEDGEVREALVSWEIASTQLRRVREFPLLVSLQRSCGDRLLTRGEGELAASQLSEARKLAEHLGDANQQALTLLSQSLLALSRGREQAARALLDEATRLLGTARDGPPSDHGRRLVDVEFEILLCHLDTAETLLRQLQDSPDLPPTPRAACMRRLADIALRKKEYFEAARWAAEARERYGQIGERCLSARCLRLLADAEALMGELAFSNQHFESAIREHIRCGDMRGLLCTLEHRVILEETHGDARLATEWRLLRDELAQYLDHAGRVGA